jgi:hypothetical protein
MPAAAAAGGLVGVVDGDDVVAAGHPRVIDVVPASRVGCCLRRVPSFRCALREILLCYGPGTRPRN